jgi:hypothetical protein
VLAHHLRGDAHILELQARQVGEVGVGLGVEAGADQVDQLDRAVLTGAGLEQLLLAGLDRARGELALHDLQSLVDLVSSSMVAQ